ncbi:ras-responsive element-binding protein 1 isoform X1 [Corythoichthys intestinalis]|uniref:ras-responsive element-binding protein 1 isoform X1 n=1 Tax=Corythoichthys intestinalis TaxID=161448 RepID=UPI0025A5FE83|nr:ras-responsive element-binding protein 1 isoform X1 [Corythoichthys intestinalis]
MPVERERPSFADMENTTEKREAAGADSAPNGGEAADVGPPSASGAVFGLPFICRRALLPAFPLRPTAAPERTDEGARSAGGGEDLSSINAMMSAVMSAAGGINGGGDAGSDVAPGPSPSPSPDKTPAAAAVRAPPGRNVRRSQDAKDERAAHVCPLCDKSCQSQHQLTMHIRQHNADAGATDHSCSICGKCLSSASSLDRHMLVHSGERPYKCSVCSQTFTTNGNMHRHMKIHEKDPASGLLPVSPPSPTKRRRPSVKRRQGQEDEGAEEPPAKKVTEESPPEEAAVPPPASAAPPPGDDVALPCPICFKTCVGRPELDTHMDTHPDTTLRCDLCCLSFRTHRGLLRHNAGVHKLLPRDPGGRPFIQSNPSIPAGFNDLAFIDFSCKKFARIAQVWCETNLRRCVGKFHRFVCERCDKAFPLRSALDLHKSHGHSPAVSDAHDGVSRDAPLSPRDHFMEALGLRHVSKVKRPPTEDEIHQAHLDSIKVIHVEPLSCSLPQEPAFLPAGTGGPAAPGGTPPDRTCTLQGLSQRDALGLLSLQPFQAGFPLQPDGGGAATAGGGSAVKPGEAAGVLEPADVRRVLKAAAAATDQTGPGFPGLKAAPTEAEPPPTPRSDLTPGTPPPLRSSQRASLGHVGPGLPPPGPALFETRPPSLADGRRLPSDSPPAAAAATREEGRKRAAGEAEGRFPCRFCDQVFSFSGVLQAHMRFHLGILPHQCNICDYVAPDKATLIRHLRTHSGERPYICRVCHYPFTVKANCERHLRKKHGKTSRKDIEKHIKCVFSAEPGVSSIDARAGRGGADAACRFCGEDLKTYRALQIHLRTHNGCRRKPFECRRCGAAFLAKRNCIHHLLKQHPEVQEREIEEHIAATAARLPALGPVKTEDYGRDPDQPLDFSAKGRGALTAVKAEGASPVSELPSSDQPVDLSVPGKRLWREEAERRRLFAEQNGAAPQRRDKPAAASPLGAVRLPAGLPPGPSPRPQRLKPLLPKPTSVKELPPLASIAQIIHSVSAAPDLLKREAAETDRQPATRSPSAPPGVTAVPETPADDTARKKNRKKSAHDVLPVLGGGVDLESSGEFASVEKMLATTDANKFTDFLQTEDVASESAAGDGHRAGGGADKEAVPKERAKTAAPLPQSKGKKNAYSNSVQKMTCPFCPRVFPWASSLQRHMLTHTGQKPFPCPRCDAFFSTKSNCERHLLRKHGVTNRTLRRNGVTAKKESDDGSPESAGSQSDAEQPVDERSPAGHPAPLRDAPPEQKAEEPAPPGPNVSGPAPTCELQPRQRAADASRETARPAPPAAERDDDDCQSDKSLDLNFGSKLIDFKLSDSAGAAPSTEAPDGPSDRKHVCGACRKTFRYATTLARHEKAHLSREEASEGKEAAPREIDDDGAEEEPETGPDEAEERGDAPESDDDDDDEDEKDERSDEEAKSPEGDEEAKSPEGGEVADGAVADKRKKKTCAVCAKRFWSLQDLTRHMRSHTGERPYRCATCERTFTLKHSLVRHQRIHANKTAGEDGGGRPPSENESAKDSDGGGRPPSENESAKDSDDGRVSDPERPVGAPPEPPDPPADAEPPSAAAV